MQKENPVLLSAVTESVQILPSGSLKKKAEKIAQ